LNNAYIELFAAASASVKKFIAANPEQIALHSVDGGESPISYNLAMTVSGMVILPRRAEGTMLRNDDGNDVGFVALNGTTLGGTMMVKHQEEWEMLCKRPEMLDNILAAIGVPRDLQMHKSRV
jgi:ATP adenylyltransferase